MQNDNHYGFEDNIDSYPDNIGVMRNPPPQTMGGFGGRNRPGGGMHRHGGKPPKMGRGSKGMIPRIPNHGGNNRMNMGGFQPY